MKFNVDIIKNFDFENKKSYQDKILEADKFLKLKQNIGENWFFEALDETNEEFKLLNFGFSASNIQLSNDSNELFIFSWNGETIDGILFSKEQINFNQLERDKIYIKNNGKIRIWSY